MKPAQHIRKTIFSEKTRKHLRTTSAFVRKQMQATTNIRKTNVLWKKTTETWGTHWISFVRKQPTNYCKENACFGETTTNKHRKHNVVMKTLKTQEEGQNTKQQKHIKQKNDFNRNQDSCWHLRFYGFLFVFGFPFVLDAFGPLSL